MLRLPLKSRLAWRVATAVALALCILPLSTKPAFATYPMTCQTGGNMRLHLSPNFRQDEMRLEIHFRKAPRAARDVRPAPGECAWWDRPVNHLEPEIIWVRLRTPIWSRFPATGAGVASTGIVSGYPQSALASEFLDILRRPGCFVLQVGNSNAGYFVAQLAIQRGC